MRAMILAAGRGERMKPLTDTCPKPLLEVGGKALIEYHLEKLSAIGVRDVVINHAWLGEKIIQRLGDGSRWDLNILYSAESDGALETAGGIKQAMSLLLVDDSPFLVVNGDVYTDFDYRNLPEFSSEVLAHLWLVENPEHNPKGDFGLREGKLVNHASEMYTFSGIAMYRPAFFEQIAERTVNKLAPLIRSFAEQQQVTASLLTKRWVDVGTPERLAQLNSELQ